MGNSMCHHPPITVRLFQPLTNSYHLILSPFTSHDHTQQSKMQEFLLMKTLIYVSINLVSVKKKAFYIYMHNTKSLNGKMQYD